MAAAWPPYCCPSSDAPLRRQNDELIDEKRQVSYPVVDNIPRFVADDKYVENFGWQWNRFAKTQLDSYTGLPISEERLQRCLGAEVWNRLDGLQVLECGCGAGRFTEVLLKKGAFVTSVDLSSAVEANARNCPPDEKHRIAKADILNLPFAPKQFDVVLCLGVIQHTPNSEETIARLYDQVKPGGWLVIDHYTHEKGRWSSIKPLVRAWMKRQDPKNTLPSVEAMIRTFLPWHRRFRANSPLWFCLCRISPIVTFYRMYPDFTEQMQKDWATLDTHDSLTDWFKHLRTEPQIRTALESLGVASLWTNKGGNGIEARAQRPQV